MLEEMWNDIESLRLMVISLFAAIVIFCTVLSLVIGSVFNHDEPPHQNLVVRGEKK